MILPVSNVTLYDFVRTQWHSLKDLGDLLLQNEFHSPKKTDQLKQEFAEYHQDKSLLYCWTMAELLMEHLRKYIFAKENWKH